MIGKNNNIQDMGIEFNEEPTTQIKNSYGFREKAFFYLVCAIMFATGFMLAIAMMR